MRPSPERLSEIDRELDALGKSDDELRAVVERARSWIASARDLDGDLASLAEGARDAVARAALAAKRSVQEEAPEAVEPPTSVMRAAPSDPSPEPVARSADIAGLSVDELFADAEPSAPTGSASSGLADLFDEEPLALPEAAESGLADLFDEDPAAAPFDRADADAFDEELRAGQTDLGSLEDVLEPSASEPPGQLPLSAPPPAVDLSLFGDEDDEITSSFSVAHVERIEAEAMAAAPPTADPSGDFELLVDEDVLELDEADLEDEGDDPDGTKPGLISRILGRK